MLTTTVRPHPDPRDDDAGVYYGPSLIRVGDHLGTWPEGDDDTQQYPISLPGGDTIDDDREAADLRADLRALGFDWETDSDGLVLTSA